jgi:hypothetical protein
MRANLVGSILPLRRKQESLPLSQTCIGLRRSVLVSLFSDLLLTLLRSYAVLMELIPGSSSYSVQTVCQNTCRAYCDYNLKMSYYFHYLWQDSRVFMLLCSVLYGPQARITFRQYICQSTFYYLICFTATKFHGRVRIGTLLLHVYYYNMFQFRCV